MKHIIRAVASIEYFAEPNMRAGTRRARMTLSCGHVIIDKASRVTTRARCRQCTIEHERAGGFAEAYYPHGSTLKSLRNKPIGKLDGQ